MRRSSGGRVPVVLLVAARLAAQDPEVTLHPVLADYAVLQAARGVVVVGTAAPRARDVVVGEV